MAHPRIPVLFGQAALSDALVVSENIRIDVPGSESNNNQDDISFFSSLKYVPRIYRKETAPKQQPEETKKELNVYVPPSARGGGGSAYSAPRRGGQSSSMDKSFTVRIGNLPPSISSEDELSNSGILSGLRHIILKNMPYGHNAYVHFSSMKEATECAEALNGYRYDHVVLEAAVLPPR